MAQHPPDLSVGEALEVQNLKAIESVLDQMWRIEAESEADGKAGEQPIVRVCLGNVAVVTEAARCAAIAEEMDRLGFRRPSRVLIAGIEPEKTEGGVKASIRAVCHRPSPDTPQICCEQIHLSCGPEDIPLLRGIVTPLMEADLPSLLWWDRDWIDCPESLIALAEDVGAIMYDFEKVRRYETLRDLGRRLSDVEISDLAWVRLEPWRREMAHVFEDRLMQPLLRQIHEVVILEAERDAPFPASSLLFHGWLAGQLRWKIQKPFEATNEGRRATVTDGERQIELWCRPAEAGAPAGRLQSVSIAGAGGSKVRISAVPKSDAIDIAVAVPKSCPLPRRASASEPSVSGVIGAWMESAAGSDRVYLRALDRGLALAGI